jgi:hypothetical protein
MKIWKTKAGVVADIVCATSSYAAAGTGTDRSCPATGGRTATPLSANKRCGSGSKSGSPPRLSCLNTIIRIVARPPVGTVPQRQSRTALFAYVAGRLAGISLAEQPGFFEAQLGVKIGRDGAEGAAARRRHPQPGKRKRGPIASAPQSPVQAEDAALFDWLLVEEHKLGLDTALIRFPGVGKRQGELLGALSKVRGVRQILELSRERDIIAVVVFDGRDDRMRLRTELEEFAVAMVWEDIESETHRPAITAWKHLAQRAARIEGFVAAAPDDRLNRASSAPAS